MVPPPPHNNAFTGRGFLKSPASLVPLLSLLFLAIGAVFFVGCKKEDKVGVKTANSVVSLEGSEKKNKSVFAATHIVPIDFAENVAKKINFIVPEKLKIGEGVKTIENIFTINDSLKNPIMYIINYSKDGYVVISGDDRYEPVCALVEHGKYESVEVPSALVNWFDVTFDNIQLIKSGLADNTPDRSDEWNRITEIVNTENARGSSKCCEDCPNYPDCLLDPKIGCGDPAINCFGQGDGGIENPCGKTAITTL